MLPLSRKPDFDFARTLVARNVATIADRAGARAGKGIAVQRGQLGAPLAMPASAFLRNRRNVRRIGLRFKRANTGGDSSCLLDGSARPGIADRTAARGQAREAGRIGQKPYGIGIGGFPTDRETSGNDWPNRPFSSRSALAGQTYAA
jgi:hypothetical protein